MGCLGEPLHGNVRTVMAFITTVYALCQKSAPTGNDFDSVKQWKEDILREALVRIVHVSMQVNKDELGELLRDFPPDRSICRRYTHYGAK